MTSYMKCIKQSKGKSEPCRQYSKLYLNCRMGWSVWVVHCVANSGSRKHSGLMEKDDWENLGLQDVVMPEGTVDHSAPIE